ncbi:N-acetylmuramoyl-L-alanine amidase [Nannocystis pusilla]
MLYGRTDLLVAIGDQQPPQSTPTWNAANRHRAVTRTVTLHYTHGWKAGDWQAPGSSWFGASFNIDLDGTLYQCEEMRVSTNHVGGGPDFTGADSFVNKTSIGVELARFGRIKRSSSGYLIEGYNPPIEFEDAPTPPDICDYSPLAPGLTGPRRFNLRKMPPATVVRARSHPYYFAKIAPFNDARNSEHTQIPLDVLFTEEQYRTLVAWVKCMCEMHRIPKDFLRHPRTGKEQPWIDVKELIEAGSGQTGRIAENKKRVKAFQGIIGHNNIQRDRGDPGASLDYYRLKRGISDAWWYPVDLGGADRAIDYIFDDVARYMAMVTYDSPGDRPRYFAAVEGPGGGHFPVGLNRLWHGGIHFTPGDPRRVYAMANGRIVAARVANPNRGSQPLQYSTCFVLVRHDVHVRNIGAEIDYGANSTAIVYSLYMHLAPLDTPSQCPFLVDYGAYPAWFNHYMIDHPDDTAPADGVIFYPDEPIALGDRLGRVGTYVVGSAVEGASYGHALHVEVFTTEDIAGFADSPWQDARNRVEDPTDDLVCELSTLDAWMIDHGAPGIDEADIREAASRMREMAIRHRSEWSLVSPDQLSPEIPAGNPVERIDADELFPDDTWDREVEPLCFHTEMVNASAPLDIVGPFLVTPIVWHVHPLVFMEWMNRRVETHERILRSQDKSRGNRSTVQVTAGYVTNFVNPVVGAAPNGGYPEVVWGECSYGITVEKLADRSALASVPQTHTRFHLRLLDAIDQINDRPHGLVVLESYAASASSVFAGRHAAGHAVDIRPARAVTPGEWHSFFQVVASTLEYLTGRDGSGSIALEMLQDPDGTTRALAEPTTASRDWLRRLYSSSGATDPALTADDPAVPNLQGQLGQMRLHLYVP